MNKKGIIGFAAGLVAGGVILKVGEIFTEKVKEQIKENKKSEIVEEEIVEAEIVEEEIKEEVIEE